VNRTIKFRAWDKKEKILVNVDGIDFPTQKITYSHPTKTHGVDNDAVIIREDFINIIVEQWTGLFDKNGKEIYEGDICWFEDSYSAVIEYDQGCFYVDVYSDFDPIYRMLNNKIEVIGNIHDNPELKEVE
jgi:uncharacterized phage protein (TIGR01671 family)